MTKEMYEKILDYRTAMSVIYDLYKKGIITAKEYDRIDTIMTKKYGLSSDTIFQ